MKTNSSITVSQTFNPKYDSTKVGQPGNHEHIYRVDKTVNTIKINQYLSPTEVQALIDSGHNVTVQPVK